MAESSPPSVTRSLRERIARIAHHVFCLAAIGFVIGAPIALGGPIAKWDVPGIEAGLIAIGFLVAIVVASVLVMFASAKCEGHR
jgi:hypothetical protein